MEPPRYQAQQNINALVQYLNQNYGDNIPKDKIGWTISGDTKSSNDFDVIAWHRYHVSPLLAEGFHIRDAYHIGIKHDKYVGKQGRIIGSIDISILLDNIAGLSPATSGPGVRITFENPVQYTGYRLRSLDGEREDHLGCLDFFEIKMEDAGVGSECQACLERALEARRQMKNTVAGRGALSSGGPFPRGRVY